LKWELAPGAEINLVMVGGKPPMISLFDGRIVRVLPMITELQ
jgi:hypothetical protein